MTAVAITKKLSQRVLEVVDAGLSSGLGNRKPGEMCIEAAICYALDLPHGDKPPCVGTAVRAFKIKLNDAAWPSNKARTSGMRRLAIAQLGSDTIDQNTFRTIVAVETVRQIIAKLCREVLRRDDLARACEAATDSGSAYKAAMAVKAAARAADAAAAYAADAAASAAARAADAAADAAAYAAARLQYLLLAAKIGEQALIECNSPGCKYLSLCEE